jgi:hypothetical protein
MTPFATHEAICLKGPEPPAASPAPAIPEAYREAL